MLLNDINHKISQPRAAWKMRSILKNLKALGNKYAHYDYLHREELSLKHSKVLFPVHFYLIAITLGKTKYLRPTGARSFHQQLDGLPLARLISGPQKKKILRKIWRKKYQKELLYLEKPSLFYWTHLGELWSWYFGESAEYSLMKNLCETK